MIEGSDGVTDSTGMSISTVAKEEGSNFYTEQVVPENATDFEKGLHVFLDNQSMNELCVKDFLEIKYKPNSTKV